jgi:ankyrin repeat protein
VWAGDSKIVELLLSRGAKPNVTGGKFYPTVLDFARANSGPELVKLLESASATAK